MHNTSKILSSMQKVAVEWRYSLLAFLLFLCFVHPCSGDTGSETVAVFKDGTTQVSHKGNDNEVTKVKPLVFGAPAFVGGMFNDNKFLAVISDAFYGKPSETTVLEPVVRTSNGDYKQWSDANAIVNSIVNTQKHKYFGKVTAVMSKDKIYVIATAFEASPALDIAHKNDIPSESFMIVGTLVNSPTPSSDGGVTIMWGEEKSIKSLLKISGNVQGPPYIVGGMGNGVVMKNGTIVFPILIKHKDNKYDSASIIYSKDEGKTWHMGKKTISGTSEGSVVEFGEGTLLLSAQSSKGFRAVYETDNMGASWRSSETFMAVWGNEKTRSLSGSQGSVITAPVEGKDVLLFSHPLNMDESHTRDTLQLWVSDGQRISCIGTISEVKKGVHTGNSILAYVDNQLYITHEITPLAEKKTGTDITKLDKVIGVTRLDDYFERAKKTVLAWRALDKKIVESGDISVHGLVGFLGNTTSDDGVWPDKYNCVNATVKGAILVKGGFLFSGAEHSGAQWPVASQGQTQLYKFTRKQFTLAATVKLHSTGGAEGFSLLGAAINSQRENINEIGLGCSQNNKWYILHGKNQKHVTTLSCDLEKEYHIAITYAYGIAHFYVNGSYLTKLIKQKPHTLDIQEFFMGSTGTHSTADGNLCTVKNVMLFNRRLEQRKIYQLFRVNKNSNLDEPLETKETTPRVVSQQSPQSSTPATTTVIDNSAKTGDSPNVPVLHNYVQTTKPASKPVSDKTPSTKTSEQAPVTEKDKPFTASKTDKHLDIALGAQQSATIKKNIKPTDSSTVSFAFFQLMCVVCSFVLLAQV